MTDCSANLPQVARALAGSAFLALVVIAALGRRLMKGQATLRLDADILDWFKRRAAEEAG